MTSKFTPAEQAFPDRSADGFATVHGGVRRISLVNAACAFAGIGLNVSSYGSLAPAFVMGLMYLGALALLLLTPLGGRAERRMFNLSFSVGLLMTGVSAIYANQLDDFGQLFSDAGGFYDLASGEGGGVTLEHLKLIHEGSLGIVIWGAVYDFFTTLGFEKGRYIGLGFNVVCVAMSGVFGIKMVRLIYGEDEQRFRRLTVMVASCGLLWLFAAIHVRDAIVLLAVTSLAFVWQYFLAKADLGYRFLMVLAACALAAAFFGYLRAEFVFVPIAMAFAATVALYFGRADRGQRLIGYVLLGLGTTVSVVLILNFSDAIFSALEVGNIGYRETMETDQNTESLGMALIVNQPLPIRLVLGSVYLFVFPIPFWTGFQLESAYHVFKSFNVIFFYFLLPLIYMTVRRLIKDRTTRSVQQLFLLFVSVGFTLSVAGTSLEGRHFGAFLIPMFVLLCLPDFSLSQVRRQYKALLSLVCAGVVLVHLMWIAIKVL